MPAFLANDGNTESLAVIERFLSSGGFPGRMESMAESTGSAPAPADVERLTNTLFKAAHDDPVAFSVLHNAGKDTLRDDVSGAISAVRNRGHNASLTKGQRSALEAIVLLIGRPALLVQKDSFTVPHGEWEMLAPYRLEIENVIRSVGRIAVAPAFGRIYEGTGFVAGPNLIMTNAHVVKDYIEKTVDGSRQLIGGTGMKIDFKQEYGSAEKLQFAISALLGIWYSTDIDLALLQVAAQSTTGDPLPAPLSIQRNAGYVADDNMVYVVGYPAADPERNNVDEMYRIFEGKYEKKRLSPGRIKKISDNGKLLSHDCSTLGGNSGSCVVDLSTHTVVGLHFEGKYLRENRAIMLPALAGDSLFGKVNFQEASHGPRR
jgi:V8-like Glu-specific endopeptidase